MNRSSDRFFAALVVFGWLALCAGRAFGQYVETTAGCVQCHLSPPPLQRDFCDTIPASVWAQDDKHRNAFWLLHETDPADPNKGAAKRELVRQILGFELREAFLDGGFTRLKDAADEETKNKVATVKACLRCHGTWPKEADARSSHEPPVSLELGVSCQGCHGPGERWFQPHFSTAWRRVTPAAKAAVGFTDVRSTVAKAKLCASCHVGSVAEEKFVKHEWYAGGHPPLPSFELASFEAQMPVHWKSLHEKGAFAFRDEPTTDQERALADQNAMLERVGIPREGIKGSFREANFPEAAAKGLDPFSDLARARDAVVGGAVVLETYVRTMGDYAGFAADNKAAWPELALYDCTACHHELRSWNATEGVPYRSRPRRSHAPGRPPLATWPNVLTQLAVAQAAGYDGAEVDMRWSNLRGQMQQLEWAATSRPFGEPRAMRAAAGGLAAALEQLANDAANTRFDDGAARKAVGLLTDAGKYETSDFYTARQAAWAICETSRDLGMIEVNVLFARGGGDPLALALPSGPNRSVMENLRRWLPAAAKYDAAWFREELKATRGKLGSP